jgi:glycosidase
MFSLPGTPVLFYGEEIGMGENLDIPGRLSVRTPMQWSSGPNGGFSTADRRRLTRPLPSGLFGPERVNVEAQRRDPASFWWFMRDLIRRYREIPQTGWATVRVLKQPIRPVLAHACVAEGRTVMVALHNLGPDRYAVPLTLELPDGARLVGVVGPEEELVPTRGRIDAEIDGYGYRWLRVVQT